MRFAYFVRIAILTGLLITSAATAAPVTFGSYYDENVTPPAICSASLCTVFFSQLPSDRLLLVTNVACAFVTPYPVTQIVLGINAGPTSGTQSRELPLQLPQPVVYAGYNYMQFNQPVHFLIGQTRYPFIQAQTGGGGGNWGMKCSISGELVTQIP